jgi:DNA-directed RNA polymerase subunit RPC12/RpoP
VIFFDCPECGEEMEIKDRMAGREVECPACDKLIRIPEKSRPSKPKRRPRAREADDELSTLEWVLFSVMFFLFPCINVLVSSILYYVWRNQYPNRASQINILGWIIFGAQILLRVGVFVVFRQ